MRLLAKEKLIEIPSDLNDMKLSPKKITSNLHQFKILELDSALLPRILVDVDTAIINTNFAIPSGLTPKTDALLLEDKNSPYANLVAIRARDRDAPKYNQLVEALHSDEVLKKAESLFKGQAIATW